MVLHGKIDLLVLLGEKLLVTASGTNEDVTTLEIENKK